jgi:hypothetical protein
MQQVVSELTWRLFSHSFSSSSVGENRTTKSAFTIDSSLYLNIGSRDRTKSAISSVVLLIKFELSSLSLVEQRLNATLKERIKQHGDQIALLQSGCIRCGQAVSAARDRLQQKHDTLLERLNSTDRLRTQRIQALSRDIFPIGRVAMVEE